MNWSGSRPGAAAIFTVALLAGFPASAAQPAKSGYCTAPEYRQFDFWIGDWDAFDVGNPAKAVARVRVDRILDGCVIREDYQDTDGKKGQSFSIYDASRKVWHRDWVTNRGQLLLLDGKFQAGEMVLSAVDRSGGKQELVRGVWKADSSGVRETGVTSADVGKTWKPWFDLLFRRHQP